MRFPENVLAEGERVERRFNPHWMTVLAPAVIGLLLVAAVVVVVWLTPDGDAGTVIQWVAVALLVVLAIPLVLVPFLRRATTLYVITSHRVMVRRGILSRYGKDITLAKITDVSFEQTLLDRIINSGSLRIESAGDSPDELLEHIPHSNEVQQLLNRLIDEDMRHRRDDDDPGRMPRGGRERDGDPGRWAGDA